MNMNYDLTLATAVNTLINILEKYNQSVPNKQIVEKAVQELASYGNYWFYAYCENSRLVDKDVLYPSDRVKQEQQEAIMDEMDSNIQKLDGKYEIYRALATGKTLVSALNDKNKKYVYAITQLSDKQSALETECENIKSSYLDAGISELIIDEFLEFQNDKYTQKKEECKKTEKQISSLEHKNDAIISDSKKLSNAIETIETHTKLKYEDPDLGRSCYRYEYDQSIKGLIEQKKDKIKI